jgi:hypothetical protein
MSLIAPSQGIQRFPSLTSFFHRGTADREIWYALGCQNQTAFTTISSTVNTLRTLPFTVSRTMRLDRMALEVTTLGASAVARFGIYRTTGISNGYPTSRVVDSGELDCGSTGVKSATVDVTLSPGYYHAAVVVGTATVVFRGLAVGAQTHIMGADNTLAALHNGWTVAFAYAALPAAFPGSATANTGTVRPVHGVRLVE